MNRFAHFLYQPCIPLGNDGRLATGCEEHIRLSHDAACEGMVLLKNDASALPLKKGANIAIFGTAQFDYVRGGGGSGDVTTAYTRNIYEGFKLKEKDGLVNIYEPVSSLFRDAVKSEKEKNGEGARCPQPDISEQLIADTRRFTDTAIFTLCRYSWEGGDRKGTPGDGDYYLSESEEKLKNLLIKNFSKVIVVLDVGAVVDSMWFKNEDRIPSVLLAWQAGIEGGLAIADTVCGLSNPSGRLVDTFPDSFDAFPSSEHFNDSKEYADYTEDIYVGYRYFETFTDAKKHVNYPFGYGLSYTEFDTKIESFKIAKLDSGSEEESVFVRVKVTNTGKMAGKTSVGLYYSAPAAKLFKPAKELGVFAKTSLLEPGESENLNLCFKISDMASFDDTGRVSKSAYVLEAGTYKFYLGANVSESVLLDNTYVVPETIIVSQLSSLCRPHRLQKRLLGDGSYEQLETDDSPVTGHTTCYHDWTVPTGRTIYSDLKSCSQSYGTGAGIERADGRVEDVPDFMDVVNGAESTSEFVKKLPIEVLIELLGGQPNTGVANTFNMGNVPEYHIPSVPTADGPAGLRINKGLGVTTTAWPIATMLACTWNTELVEKVGAAGALEVKENHIGLWLTPAMNIHRSPLCGRNFEYYSEDPLMAGKMGAAMIRGIQSQKIGCSMKHFACNNKEENRMCCDSRVSERALREIYLKGFEIAVKESDPWTIMTSYNIINGTYSSQNKELITGILRGEWGFKGMITTDWMNWSSHVNEVKAGNDLKMPIGEPKVLLDAFNSGELSRAEIEACAIRILDTIKKFD